MEYDGVEVGILLGLSVGIGDKSFSEMMNWTELVHDAMIAIKNERWMIWFK